MAQWVAVPARWVARRWPAEAGGMRSCCWTALAVGRKRRCTSNPLSRGWGPAGPRRARRDPAGGGRRFQQRRTEWNVCLRGTGAHRAFHQNSQAAAGNQARGVAVRQSD